MTKEEPTDPAALAEELERQAKLVRKFDQSALATAIVTVENLDLICQHLRSLAELREQREAIEQIEAAARDPGFDVTITSEMAESGQPFWQYTVRQYGRPAVTGAEVTLVETLASAVRSTASPAPGKEGGR